MVHDLITVLYNEFPQIWKKNVLHGNCDRLSKLLESVFTLGVENAVWFAQNQMT